MQSLRDGGSRRGVASPVRGTRVEGSFSFLVSRFRFSVFIDQPTAAVPQTPKPKATPPYEVQSLAAIPQTLVPVSGFYRRGSWVFHALELVPLELAADFADEGRRDFADQNFLGNDLVFGIFRSVRIRVFPR